MSGGLDDNEWKLKKKNFIVTPIHLILVFFRSYFLLLFSLARIGIKIINHHHHHHWNTPFINHHSSSKNQRPDISSKEGKEKKIETTMYAPMT